MQMQMKGKITIDAPVDKVWAVLGRDFSRIDQWASIITKSSGAEIPESELNGRVCSAKGFGDTLEALVNYDEAAMCFTYKALKGLPWFMTSAQNNWSVRELGNGQCEVASRAEIYMRLFPGIILAPLFKLMMGRKSREMFEELKFFVENDRPHPRKLRQMEQAVTG